MNQVDLTVYEAKSGKPAKVSLVQNLIFYQDFYAVLLGKNWQKEPPSSQIQSKSQVEKKIHTGYQPLPPSEDEEDLNAYCVADQPDIDELDEDYVSEVEEQPDYNEEEQELSDL